MEEINLLEILKYLKKHLLIIIIGVALFLYTGLIYTFYLQAPKYKSETTLLLKANNVKNVTYSQSDVLLNQNLITTYTEIIKSRKILTNVIKDLDLDITLTQISKMIEVTSEDDSLLITITVTSKNKTLAMQIANSIAKIFSKEIKNLLDMQNVGIVDEAVRAKTAYNVKPVQQIAISVAAGLLLSVATLFVIFYFDTTVKNEEQIESVVNLPVIGIIPERKKRGVQWKKN